MVSERSTTKMILKAECVRERESETEEETYRVRKERDRKKKKREKERERKRTNIKTLNKINMKILEQVAYAITYTPTCTHTRTLTHTRKGAHHEYERVRLKMYVSTYR